jgi:hypothetical protein
MPNQDTVGGGLAHLLHDYRDPQPASLIVMEDFNTILTAKAVFHSSYQDF